MPAYFRGRRLVCGIGGVVVVCHLVRLLMAAVCADEYLSIHMHTLISRFTAWLNQFEPEFTIAYLAA